MTAQYDPLRDEGLECARRLIEAGVPVELHNVPGVFHGFTTLPSDTSRRVLGWRTYALARVLGVEVPGSTGAIGSISEIFGTLAFLSGASPPVALPANVRSEERVRAT